MLLRAGSVLRLSLHAIMQRTTKVLINGEFRDSETHEWIEVKNPVRSLCYCS